jgi:hypothetical protein
MRIIQITFILFLFCFKSYSQEYEDLFYDEQLQIVYKDTLQSIGKRLTGDWKYLGNRNRINDGILTDTISLSYSLGEIATLIIFENGVYYEIVEGERKKADYFYKTSFDFISDFSNYSYDKIYFNKNITEITSSQPIPELIYYKNCFGILYNFRPAYELDIINVLTDKKLIFKNGEEYVKLE